MPEEIKPEEVEVTFLDRSKFTFRPTLEEEVEMMSITFSTPKIPPMTIRIPVKDYTPEKEEEEIRKAIKEFKVVKPEVKRIKL